MTPFIKYPLGIQTFSEIREEGYVYLDKTALIYQMVNSGKAYFLSRPRRFGKSLLVSTLESLFSGHKSLFEGLAITDSDYDFAQYPVVILEFSAVDVRQGTDLEQYIINTTNQHALTYGVTLEIDSYEQRFAELMRKLHHKTGNKVVLLVDEYDKPILDNLLNDQLNDIRNVMSRFYAGVKSLDKHLKFIFITGVSKFAKISVFSGMNNLTDISLDRQYATICGVTQHELESNFVEPIKQLTEREQIGKSHVLDKIKLWYNGYRFHQDATGVYNPYSLLSLWQFQEFKNYWFATATPTFLIDLLKSQQFDLSELTDFEVDEEAFMATEPEQMSPLPVMLQTGYLTIASYDDGWYRLDFPNFEVKYAFNRAIIEQYGKTPKGLNTGYIRKLSTALNKHDLTAFFDTLRIFFANIPNNITIKDEKYYQSLFYAIMTLLGYQLDAEVNTNIGRIDCVLQTEQTVFIIEFKLNDSCTAALQQIKDKQYAQKYQNSGKAIVLLGVEFDQAGRNIGEFITENG